MNIKTENQGAAWTAIDGDTYDGASDSNCPVGVGITELSAINDLVEQITEHLEDKVEEQRHEIRCLRAENKGLQEAKVRFAAAIRELTTKLAGSLDRSDSIRLEAKPPETTRTDAPGCPPDSEVGSGQLAESTSPTIGPQEQDREETRCQGRMSDKRIRAPWYPFEAE